MVMWKFKSCPRCGGDIFVDSDQHSWYEQCLQCGYLRDMPNTVETYQYREKKERELLRRSR